MSSSTVLFDAPGPKAKLRHRILTILGGLVLVWILVVVLRKFQQAGQLEPSMWKALFTSDAWRFYVIPGMLATLKAAALSIVLALGFGVLFGVGRLSSFAPLRWMCGVIVEFFRAVPVLLSMYFLFLFFALRQTFGSDYNSFAAVVIALTLYNGSVIAELVRSGVFGLPKGQREAGLSVGLSRAQSLRFIEVPQALTAMLPALVSQLVVVLKDTALGTAITYPELLEQLSNTGTAYGNVIPAYVLAAVLFILLNLALTTLAGRIERRLNRRGKTAGSATPAQPDVAEA